MARYRCQNEDCSEDPHGRLIFDFDGPDPVCPKCKADMRRPEGSGLIVPLVDVCLLVKDPAGPIVTAKGRLRVACRPGVSKLPTAATNVPAAATCPACRASDAFKAVDAPVVAAPPPPAGTALVG